MKNIKICIGIFLLSLSVVSCNDFLDLTPIDSPTENVFYNNIKGLNGGLIGAYDELQNSGQYGSNVLTMMEVRADNVDDRNPGGGAGVRYEIESFAETPANKQLQDAWLSLYRGIYRCNLVIQSAANVSLSEQDEAEILGQAQFIRALSYFNLVRNWGKVPLITKVQTVDESRNNQRAEVPAIYSQIETDLKAAQNLPAVWPDAERGRVTKYAALSLLGKVYLYQKRYQDVINTLQPVVDAIDLKKDLYLVPQPQTFPNNLKTSKDIIFAVQYLSGGIGESVHQNNRYRNNDNTNVITLPQSEFEDGDNRKILVAPTGNAQRPGKFNTPQMNNETSSDFPVLRCAEVLLMYAEALNEISYPNTEAFNRLNQVRKNANLSLVIDESNAPTQDALRQAIYQERRLELALEADRWPDIVRTDRMTQIYPNVSAYRKLYPVPQAEIENVNNKEGWQNEGYTLE